MQEYLSVGDAAKRLGVVPATVKLMVRSGRLQPTAKTAGGVTLFDPIDVERLALERAAMKGSQQTQGQSNEQKGADDVE